MHRLRKDSIMRNSLDIHICKIVLKNLSNLPTNETNQPHTLLRLHEDALLVFDPEHGLAALDVEGLHAVRRLQLFALALGALPGSRGKGKGKVQIHCRHYFTMVSSEVGESRAYPVYQTTIHSKYFFNLSRHKRIL